MSRKEKEMNSRQSNYRCEKNSGLCLTVGTGERNGRNSSSLCLDMVRILRTGLSGFTTCLLKQEPQTFALEMPNSESERLIPRPAHDCLAVWPWPGLFNGLRFSCSPWKKQVMTPVCAVSQGVSWKTNEIMDLQEHDAVRGTMKI